MDDEKYMRLALNEARRAFESGEFPVGCVIVQQGQVVATGARLGTADPRVRPSEVDHAEIRALKALEGCDIGLSGKDSAPPEGEPCDGSGAVQSRRQMMRKVSFDPQQSVLYCTMEPCLMCYAATILSGIKRIVYAYEDVMGGGTGCDLSLMTPLYRDSDVTVVSHVLRDESLALFADFFSKKDNRYWRTSLLETYTLEQAKNLRR